MTVPITRPEYGGNDPVLGGSADNARNAIVYILLTPRGNAATNQEVAMTGVYLALQPATIERLGLKKTIEAKKAEWQRVAIMALNGWRMGP